MLLARKENRFENRTGANEGGYVGDVNPEPQPVPSRRAETASSKSRAVAGSTVKVGRPVRSCRAASIGEAAACSAASSTSAGTRAGRDAPGQRLRDVTGIVDPAKVPDRRARPAPNSTQAIWPSRVRALRSSAIDWPARRAGGRK